MLGEVRVCVRADNTSDYIQYFNYGAKINKKLRTYYGSKMSPIWTNIKKLAPVFSY